jgi:HEAT repeat protein
MEEADMERLQGLLGSKDGKDRMQALMEIEALAEEKPVLLDSFIQPLVDLLDSGDEFAKMTSARVLAKLSEIFVDEMLPAAPALTALLKDPNLGIRRYAAYALANLGEENPDRARDGVMVLLEYLTEGDDIEKANAACGLALLAKGNPDLVMDSAQVFKDALGEDNEVVQTNSAYILGIIGNREPDLVRDVVPELIELLDSSPGVQENAAYALAQIGVREPELIAPAVPRLMEMIKDARDDVRASSACALGATCNPEVMKCLGDLMEDPAVVNVYFPEANVFRAATVSDLVKEASKRAKED